MVERSLVFVKPEALDEGLSGEFIRRIESEKGLRAIFIRMVCPSEAFWRDHYKKDDEWCARKGSKVISAIKDEGGTIDKIALDYGREIVEQLISFMKGKKVLMIIFEGDNAIGRIKKIVGPTDPNKADRNTIRGFFSDDSAEKARKKKMPIMNYIHCSDSPENAKEELDLWNKYIDIDIIS